MVERRVRHEYFSFPSLEEINQNDIRWFLDCQKGLQSLISAQEDVRFSRFLAASMLIEAWNREEFFTENGRMNPEPSELDRMLLITYLQLLVSCTGLINGEEIKKIQESGGKIGLDGFRPKSAGLPSDEETGMQAIAWKEKGLKIGLLHGSFDPVTVVHLACATEAYQQCDRLLVAFDSNVLLKRRKGLDRPRFSLDWRRQIFASFWMVDGTFVLSANDESEEASYVRDYKHYRVDYVFLAKDQEDMTERKRKILLAGAEPRYTILQRANELSATEILKEIERKRGWGKP